MPSAGIFVKDLRKLEQKLLKMGPKVSKRVTKGAMTKARKVVIKAIRVRTPVDRGDLKKSIGAKRIAKARAGFAMDIIGARNQKSGGKNKDGSAARFQYGPAQYAHLVEFGTKPHAQTLDISHLLGVRGPVFQPTHHPGAQAKPFMRPGWQASRLKALSVFEKEYAKGVRQAAG